MLNQRLALINLNEAKVPTGYVVFIRSSGMCQQQDVIIFLTGRKLMTITRFAFHLRQRNWFVIPLQPDALPNFHHIIFVKMLLPNGP